MENIYKKVIFEDLIELSKLEYRYKGKKRVEFTVDQLMLKSINL